MLNPSNTRSISSPRSQHSHPHQSSHHPRPIPTCSSKPHQTLSLSRPSSSSGQQRSRHPLLLHSDPDPETSEPYMTEPPSPTPTPRKSVRRKPRAPQPRSGLQRGEGEESEENDKKELEGLLGVVDPSIGGEVEGGIGRKGVLAISKADREASGSNPSMKARETTPNKQGVRTRSQRQVLPQEVNTQSESDTPRSTTSRVKLSRKQNSSKPTPNQTLSNLSAQLASHPILLPNSGTSGLISPEPSTSAYDVSSLSRSLPSDTVFAPSTVSKPTTRRGKKKKGVLESEDESKMWDEPSDPGPTVVEDMTWQQRLGSYPNAEPPTVTRTTSTPSGTKKKAPKQQNPIPVPSPLNPTNTRPSHSRRSSADTLPLASHTRHLSFPIGPNGSKPPPPSAYPLSTFDTLPPFNPNVNVHRAPQTPAKGGLARKYAVMELPLLKGGFPRVNNGNESGDSGMGVSQSRGGGNSIMEQAGNYAGASFHNSPHGRALPKPDMEDF